MSVNDKYSPWKQRGLNLKLISVVFMCSLKCNLIDSLVKRVVSSQLEFRFDAFPLRLTQVAARCSVACVLRAAPVTPPPRPTVVEPICGPNTKLKLYNNSILRVQRKDNKKKNNERTKGTPVWLGWPLTFYLRQINNKQMKTQTKTFVVFSLALFKCNGKKGTET